MITPEGCERANETHLGALQLRGGRCVIGYRRAKGRLSWCMYVWQSGYAIENAVGPVEYRGQLREITIDIVGYESSIVCTVFAWQSPAEHYLRTIASNEILRNITQYNTIRYGQLLNLT